MVNIIGKGVEELDKWILKCKEQKGMLIVRTSYAGKIYDNQITVACYSPQIPLKGGTFSDLSMDIIVDITKEQKSLNKLTFKKMEEIILKYKSKAIKIG